MPCLVLSYLVLSCLNARLCRCANETKQGGGGAAEGLKLKLDGSSSRFCDAGRLLASVTALMAAEVVVVLAVAVAVVNRVSFVMMALETEAEVAEAALKVEKLELVAMVLVLLSESTYSATA